MAPIDIVKIIIFALFILAKNLIANQRILATKHDIFTIKDYIAIWNSRFIFFSILTWSLINCALFFR
ncbi:MAG: hypothetical protein MR658_00105 [Campylobacter sp.]|uniref:hypothetical protein n=1 Tax=Campylobacter sp. TaxID=205 RepID=UPI002A8E28CB|nr:hypothetical protein [Campylobacter sp.]MCI6177229.1 hypothetical protein [Campylobacter sp.]MDY3663514.1 hypothetical protein [Campylobacter sp.]MDY4013527.1 hypothetical protein [Campylobacter sp.]